MDTKELRVVVSSCAAQCVGNATWWMQPVLMHQLVATDGMSETLAGLIITIEMLGLSLGSALLNRVVGERSPMFGVALWGSVLGILGAALAVFWEHHTLWLTMARLAVGVGTGAAFMASNRLAATTSVPEKTFAKLGVANVAYGALLIGVLPHIGISMETGSFTLFVIALVLMLPLVLLTPRAATGASAVSAGIRDDAAGQGAEGSAARIAVIAAGSFAISLCSATVWVFYWIVGEKAGMSSDTVGNAVTTAIFAGGLGSAIAVVIGGRFGRAVPACFGLAALVSAVLMLSSHPGPLGFRVATCLQLGAIYFLFPFLQAAAAAEDASGVGASYVGSAFFTAGALAPLIGSLVVEYVGFSVVAASIAVVSLVLAVTLLVMERRVGALASRVVG